jgi:ribonuclease HII
MRRGFDPSLLPPEPDLNFEQRLWKAGIRQVAGIDEAGRGALAGPVAAAAVILPAKPTLCEPLHGMQDSKQLSAAERFSWAESINQVALASAVGFASHVKIDQLGIVPATRLAAQRALERLSISPDHLLLDYLFLPDNEFPQTFLVKGDARSLSIAAASILAKVSRDLILRDMDLYYPGYKFAEHKGYGTPQHLDALDRLGPCLIHRLSFAPIKNMK